MSSLFDDIHDKINSHQDLTTAEAILVLAEAVEFVGKQIQQLGNGNAATPMGAIENLAKEVKDGFEGLSNSIFNGLDNLGNR